MDIQKIVVCGAGVMGSGIAQVCANAGYEVWMYDLKEEYAQGGKDKIAAVRGVKDGNTEALFNARGKGFQRHRLFKIADAAHSVLSERLYLRKLQKISQNVIDTAIHAIGACMEGNHGDAALDQLDDLAADGCILG